MSNEYFEYQQSVEAIKEAMDLRQLETFRTVATTLNFTRAATQLGYAQSSVTAQIQALESELGVPLFDRLGRQTLLTEAGQRLVGYATRMLHLADEARSVVGAGDEPSGSVTISAPETLCTYRLPALLQAARTQLPKVRVIFRPTPATALRRAVRDGDIDLAFVLESISEGGGLLAEPLVDEPIVLVGPVGHPFEQLAVVPEQLTQVPLLLTEAGCAYRVRFERALGAAGVVPEEMLEFASVEAIKQCVIAGMGLAVLPAIAVAREVEAGQLAQLDWRGSSLAMTTQMVVHGERWSSPALDSFRTLARAVLHG